MKEFLTISKVHNDGATICKLLIPVNSFFFFRYAFFDLEIILLGYSFLKAHFSQPFFQASQPLKSK